MSFLSCTFVDAGDGAPNVNPDVAGLLSATAVGLAAGEPKKLGTLEVLVDVDGLFCTAGVEVALDGAPKVNGAGPPCADFSSFFGSLVADVDPKLNGAGFDSELGAAPPKLNDAGLASTEPPVTDGTVAGTGAIGAVDADSS